MTSDLVLLRKVLVEAMKFPWGHALYMPPEKPWSLTTPCIVHDVDDVEDEDGDLPNIVIEQGFDYVVGMQVVQDIIDNLKAQTVAPSDQDYLKAFLFYIENDAFIVGVVCLRTGPESVAR